MKKLIALLLVVIMTMTLFAACGGDTTDPTGTSSSSSTTEEPTPGVTYTYAVKDSEIRITTEPDTGRCAADGGYTAHGKYLLKDDYLICYGPCEEDNGVKAIWAYVACDADLEVVGGMASAFKINEDNSLTKVQTYALSLRGSQAIFVYDPAAPEQIMLISFYEGNAYHAVGACLASGNYLYLYGDVTGGDPSWGPMLWPSVKGAYSINIPTEESEDPVNTLNVLKVYDMPENGGALILLNEEGNECGFASISDYGKFFATGACAIEGDTLTTSGDCTNPDAPAAAQVWGSCAGTYTLDHENLEAYKGEAPVPTVELLFASSTDANGYGINLNFYSDYTWKMYKGETFAGFEGTWSVNNGKLVFTYTEEGETITAEQACAEGVITIVYGPHTFTANESDLPAGEVTKIFVSSTDANGYGINLDFYSDGTWRMVKGENDVGYSGTWAIENGKFVFTYTQDGAEVTAEQTCTDGVITIIYGSHTFTVNAGDVPGYNG